MNLESVLIIILSSLVVFLGVLLFVRIYSKDRQLGALERMNLVEFSEFLRANSMDGNIQAVAGKVSTLLTRTFGCERIIFLRKKRGHLDLNYYYGLSDFNRRDFSLPFKSGLAGKLSKDFLPMKIESISSVVPPKLIENLKAHQVDVYFPIYWRSNLYGIYFIKSNKQTRSAAFTLLIASLAHSLSAAYHIKWHESRLAELEKQLGLPGHSVSKASVLPDRRDGLTTELLPLVKIKDPNVLMPRIVNLLGEGLKFEKFSFAYTTPNDDRVQKLFNKGIKEKVELPESEVIKKLSQRMEGLGPSAIEDLKGLPDTASDWLKELKKSGLDFITAFPSSGHEQGLLAWSGPALSKELKSGLSTYRRLAGNLYENAESYQHAEMMSHTDALTGLSNQRYMYKRLEEEINRSRRYDRQLAFVIFDIDDLKTVNDTYGHQAGDALIKQVGQSLKKSIRAIDIVARYGGDEFCVVMPESDEEISIKFMKRMLEAIAQTEIKLDGLEKPLHCSVSMGGALFPKHAKDPQKLVYAADMALLEAKESGRNRFVINTPIESDAGS